MRFDFLTRAGGSLFQLLKVVNLANICFSVIPFDILSIVLSQRYSDTCPMQSAGQPQGNYVLCDTLSPRASLPTKADTGASSDLDISGNYCILRIHNCRIGHGTHLDHQSLVTLNLPRGIRGLNPKNVFISLTRTTRRNLQD